MVQINFASREINCKIVYYGPGRSGKTTNLEIIHQKSPTNSRGELISIATETDRTLFFDFMPLDLGTVAGMNTKFQIYTVPGQVFYDATRRLVLQGADGVVFVADSQRSVFQENADSLENLRKNLAHNGLDPDSIPLVLQWNKRDLPGILPVEELDAKLNPKGLPSFEAVAIKGEGVFKTLKAIASLVLQNLNKEYGSRPAAAASAAAPRPAQPAAAEKPKAAPAILARPTAPVSAARPTQPAAPVQKPAASAKLPEAPVKPAAPVKPTQPTAPVQKPAAAPAKPATSAPQPAASAKPKVAPAAPVKPAAPARPAVVHPVAPGAIPAPKPPSVRVKSAPLGSAAAEPAAEVTQEEVEEAALAGTGPVPAERLARPRGMKAPFDQAKATFKEEIKKRREREQLRQPKPVGRPAPERKRIPKRIWMAAALALCAAAAAVAKFVLKLW